MDTFQKLQQAWKYKHIKFLTFFLEHHSDYYDGTFTYKCDGDGDIIIDGVIMSDNHIIEVLANYYDDSGDYETPFGDFLYLVFTDMVEGDVDILSLIEEEDVA